MNSKAYTKDDLKKLMQERKQEKLNSKKIDSPLANYDKNGNLYCKICELKIDNPNFWTKHLVSREHKSVLERLKNQQLNDKKRKLEDNQNDLIKNKQHKQNNELNNDQQNNLNNNSNNNQQNLNENQNNQEELKGDLPKGFFDDPEEDAKARDEIFKDPLDDEFAKFQKTIQEEDKVAEIIIETDLVDEQNYRELNEIDEQFEHWKRINNLEIKREEKKLRINKMEIDKNDNPNQLSDDDDDDLEQDLEDEFNILSNWRSKKAI